jgi:hypothetical protein
MIGEEEIDLLSLISSPEGIRQLQLSGALYGLSILGNGSKGCIDFGSSLTTEWEHELETPIGYEGSDSSIPRSGP